MADDEYDWRVPSVWMRALGIGAGMFLVGYGIVGVSRNDLEVGLVKNSPGVHLHGALAWVCFAGMTLMSVGLVRFLACFGEGRFDFDARRRRFGPMFVIGLVIYAAAQFIGDPRA
jgi:hypothetical protein